MAAVASPTRMPKASGRLLDHMSIAAAVRATASRSQLIVAVSAKAGASAIRRPSHGRRRCVRATQTAITAVQIISMPALTSQYACSCSWTEPPPGVSQAATCMNSPVRTGYSRNCMSPGSRSKYGTSPSAKPRPEYRCGMSE